MGRIDHDIQCEGVRSPVPCDVHESDQPAALVVCVDPAQTVLAIGVGSNSAARNGRRMPARAISTAPRRRHRPGLRSAHPRPSVWRQREPDQTIRARHLCWMQSGRPVARPLAPGGMMWAPLGTALRRPDDLPAPWHASDATTTRAAATAGPLCFRSSLSVPMFSVKLRTRRAVGAVVGCGQARADAQPYLGPRSRVAPERRHDG